MPPTDAATFGSWPILGKRREGTAGPFIHPGGNSWCSSNSPPTTALGGGGNLGVVASSAMRSYRYTKHRSARASLQYAALAERLARCFGTASYFVARARVFQSPEVGIVVDGIAGRSDQVLVFQPAWCLGPGHAAADFVHQSGVYPSTTPRRVEVLVGVRWFSLCVCVEPRTCCSSWILQRAS